MRILSFLFVAAISALSFAGCGDDPKTTGGTAGAAGSGGNGSGGEGGSGGSGGGTGGSAPAAGHCGKSCAMPVDCCPAGVPMCPGAYPTNWTCDNGTCGAPQCTSDNDCTFGGAVMGYACMAVSGYKVCQKTCMADGDCSMLMLTCSGTDDAGAKYCSTTTMGGGCKADADCMGYGKCNTTSGACECSADGDCTAMGVDKCVQ